MTLGRAALLAAIHCRVGRRRRVHSAEELRVAEANCPLRGDCLALKSGCDGLFAICPQVVFPVIRGMDASLKRATRVVAWARELWVVWDRQPIRAFWDLVLMPPTHLLGWLSLVIFLAVIWRRRLVPRAFAGWLFMCQSATSIP